MKPGRCASDTSCAPTETFHASCRQLGLEVSPPAIDALQHYLELLLEANRYMNLTAVKEPAEAWMRHVLDSLSLLPFLRDAGIVIDVGSGGGLPGLPLAIARPDLEVVLLEATGKKCAFLCEAAAALELPNVQIIHDRAEALCREESYREAFDLCLVRGVTLLRRLVEFTLPLVRVDGRLLAMKGMRAGQEVIEAGQAIALLGGKPARISPALPGIEDTAVVVEIEKEKPSPSNYPRAYGLIKNNPL